MKNVSYVNLVMYNAVVPTYSSKKEENNKFDPRLDANAPGRIKGDKENE